MRSVSTWLCILAIFFVVWSSMYMLHRQGLYFEEKLDAQEKVILDGIEERLILERQLMAAWAELDKVNNICTTEYRNTTGS